MAAAELVMAATGIVQIPTTKGINYYDECPGDPSIEIIRVNSDADGDYFYSRKFEKIKVPLVQNHGTTFNTGSRAPPKIVVTQGTDGKAAKITIYHESAAESIFSFIIFGDL